MTMSKRQPRLVVERRYEPREQACSQALKLLLRKSVRKRAVPEPPSETQKSWQPQREMRWFAR